MVALHHYTAGGAGFGPFARLVSRGYQAIDLLFVLSGHVMALAHGGHPRTGRDGVAYPQFLGRRLGRVYLLYLDVTLTCLAFIAGQDAAVLHSVLAGAVPRRGPLDVFGAATPLPLLRCIAGCTLGLAAFRLAQALAVGALDTRAVLPHEAACRPGGHSWESS